MRRHKQQLLLLLLIGGIFVTGCQAGTAQEDKDITKENSVNEQESGETQTEQTEQVQGEQPEEEQNEGQAETGESMQSVKVTVYFPDGESEGFQTEEVELPEITPELLLTKLSEKGVIPGDVEILSFREAEAEGEKALEMDMNTAFRTFVQSLGTAGEYTVIGSICNTFLEAYDCQKIQITIEGETLETGHAEYPGYMSMFQ